MEVDNINQEELAPLNEMQEAIRSLQTKNILFEGRLNYITEALAQLNAGIESIKQLMSPILPEKEDQKSVESGEHAVDMGDIFPNNEDDEINLSFRDNEAAVLSIRSKNIGLRQKESKSKVSKNERRESAMIRNLDRLTSGQDDNVRVYKSTPSYEHIKLTSDNISNVLEFASAIEQFQNMHKISVPAASLVSADIREYLIGVADNPRINSMTFFGLDNTSVFSLLQKLKRPKNTLEFRRAMDNHLRFNIFKDYRPILTNFKPLYSSLLVYKQNFQKLYDFLADGIKSEYIPRADNKDGGLIKIFIDKIPMGIGRRMYHNLNKEKFTDMDEFIKAFYSQLQVLHEVSVEVTKLSSVIYEATSTPQQEKTISRTLNLTDPSQLDLVDQLLDNLESEEPAGSLAFISKNFKNSGATSGADKKDPLACFSMAIEGSCKRESCTYSHEPSILSAYLSETLSKIMKSPYYKPRSIVSSSTPGQSKPYQKQHNLTEGEGRKQAVHGPDQLTVLNLNFKEPSLAEVLRQSFLNLHPEVGNISAMHRDGAIVLKKTLIQLDKVLFDSGAIHASYISPRLVNRYRSMLESFVRPISGSVTLGDAKTTHSVEEVVTLKLSFIDDDLEEHKGTVELVVFESGSHIIIGLPDIARTFGRLFIKMVEKAMSNPALLQHHVKTKPSAQAVICHSYYANQCLHSLSGSVSETDEELFFRGVRTLSREETSEDEREYQEYDSSADYQNDSNSWDTSSRSGLFSHQRAQEYTDPVDSDSWIERWNARSDEEYVAESDSLESQTFDENSPAEYEQSISSTSDESDDVPPLVDDESISSESDMSEDSLEDDEDVYNSLHYYDDEDAWSDSFESDNACYNMNIGSAEKPWTVYLESAPEDDNTPLPCSFPDFLSFMEMGYKESLNAYLDALESHVHLDFAKQTKIMELLQTKGAKVFVPQNWQGIKVPPLHINFIEGMPATMKPKARPINPNLYEHAKKEFDRLLSYMYVRCDGPVASPLVIAPKATAPYIRFCGDYQAVNKFIPHWHTPIPHPQRTISEKLVNHDSYGDIDMTNGFHQLPIDEETSMKLSIQTPWGQVRPLFLPEGVPIGNAHLQQTMSEIFKDFDWAIVIFDNILICANGYNELYEHFEIVIDQCIKYNVTLKMGKTWLGFPEVKFFGYVCRKGFYELAKERKEALNQIPFPTDIKGMQSFLGFALFFKPFISKYSILAAPLNDMTHKDFNWDPKTWKVDYRAVWQQFKDECNNSMGLHYNDPALPKLVRQDAAEKVGVGAVLLQIRTLPDGTNVLEPIMCASAKFSGPATRWTTIEQECFAIYFAILTFAYFLYGNVFTIETDHNNLRWMEQSKVPKIIRWCAYLQSFQFLVRHIPGKQNVVADFLSRFMFLFRPLNLDYAEGEDEVEQLGSHVLAVIAEEQEEEVDGVTKIFRACHNSRVGHFGGRRTFNIANKHFPGHGIPIRVFMDLVAACVICQKYRLGMLDNLKPVVRHLKPPHHRSVIGCDTLEISPRDKFGNLYVDIIVNHSTKLVKLYAKPEKSAVSTATSLFLFMCAYGLFDVIMTDPGSDFKSEVVGHLVRWFGMLHVFSLIDRHESNGVEGTCKQVSRHVRVLTQEERIKDEWSSPTVLPLIEYIVNSHENSETGVIPLEATFGSKDSIYMTMPDGLDPAEHTHEFVRRLDENLAHLRAVSKRFQEQLIAERTSVTPAETQNTYQPGDFVLFERNKSVPRPNKLTPDFQGPFEVVSQNKNDVSTRNLVYGNVRDYHVERLKPFFGTRSEAIELAKRDSDQFDVERILAYRGDPDIRTTMEFNVLFKSGDAVWLTYTQDIFQMIQFENYCNDTPGLYFLQYSSKDADKRQRAVNKQPITTLQPGESIYVDIRTWGAQWYQSIGLPDMYTTRYVDKWEITGWKREPFSLYARSALYGKFYVLNHAGVLNWGRWKLLSEEMIELTPAMFDIYPLLRA